MGIRELKARLSHHLDRVAAGETIVVTDRGKTKADLRPLSVDERLEQLIREGRVTPARRPGLPSVELLGLEGKSPTGEVLDEDRGA